MFEKAKILNSFVRKKPQSLILIILGIPRNSKRYFARVYRKAKNPEIQCLKKQKFGTPMFRKRQNPELSCLKKSNV